MPPSADLRGHTTPRVAIVIDRADWHTGELARALRALGVAAVPMRLEASAFDTGSPSGLHLDGFGAAVPDAVFVRTVAGGSFESVTLRLGILHALRELGVLMWNDARAI